MSGIVHAGHGRPGGEPVFLRNVEFASVMPEISRFPGGRKFSPVVAGPVPAAFVPDEAGPVVFVENLAWHLFLPVSLRLAIARLMTAVMILTTKNNLKKPFHHAGRTRAEIVACDGGIR